MFRTWILGLGVVLGLVQCGGTGGSDREIDVTEIRSFSEDRLLIGDTDNMIISDLETDQVLTVEVSSSAFVPYVELQNPVGSYMDVDAPDFGMTEAIVEAIIPGDGDYEVIVSSDDGESKGPYSISYKVSEVSEDDSTGNEDDSSFEEDDSENDEEESDDSSEDSSSSDSDDESDDTCRYRVCPSSCMTFSYDGCRCVTNFAMCAVNSQN